MSLPAMLDVVIGLVFFFLLLSLVVTAANEVISRFLGLRERNLKGSLRRLIKDDALLNDILNTGVIQPSSASNDWFARFCTLSNGPSYISGRNFALAIIEAVSDPNELQDAFKDVSKTVQKLPESKIRNALVTITTAAGKTADDKLDAISGYFEDAMERASGGFRRSMSLISLFVGLALALALNADAIQIGKALWTDQSLRKQIAATADQMAEVFVEPASYPEDIADIQDQLDQQRPFPLGWKTFDVDVHDTKAVLSKAIGILITAFATMLGAPFWFDLLGRVVKMRSTGGLTIAQKSNSTGSGSNKGGGQ